MNKLIKTNILLFIISISSVFSQNTCWTNSTGNIGDSTIFTCNSGTTLRTADTVFVRHALTIGAANNQVVNYSNYNFEVMSLENNSTLTPYGANNELTLPNLAIINVNTGSSIVQPNNQSQGTAINVPTNTSTICVWGTKCCVGNQSIVGPGKLIYSSPCNFTVPLPVKLISFEGIISNSSCLLTWESTLELNFKGYEVLKSIDGVNYQSIGMVESLNNSEQIKKYMFEDRQLLEGNNFYKLRMIDIDGSSSYSPIVPVNNDQKNLNNTVNIYPNPSNGELSLDFGSQFNIENATIKLIDMKGKLMYESSILEMNQPLSINIESLNMGVYTLQIIKDDTVLAVKRVIKY
jgi:hypothetical protein